MNTRERVIALLKSRTEVRMCVSCIMGELGLPALKYGSEIVRKLGSPSVRGLGFAREWTVCPSCGNRRLTIYWRPEPAFKG